MHSKATLERAARMREKIAYSRINLGLTVKECATRTGCSVRMAEHHWGNVLKIIRTGTRRLACK